MLLTAAAGAGHLPKVVALLRLPTRTASDIHGIGRAATSSRMSSGRDATPPVTCWAAAAARLQVTRRST